MLGGTPPEKNQCLAAGRQPYLHEKEAGETVSTLKIEAPREGEEKLRGSAHATICEKAATVVRSFVQYPKLASASTAASWVASVSGFPVPSYCGRHLMTGKIPNAANRRMRYFREALAQGFLQSYESCIRSPKENVMHIK